VHALKSKNAFYVYLGVYNIDILKQFVLKQFHMSVMARVY